MRIALGQTNPTVGAVKANTVELIACIEQAKQAGAKLVVFPELAVVGYPPKDLLLKPALLEQCVDAVDEIAGHCVGITAIVGYPARNPEERGRDLLNAVAVCADGEVVSTHAKTLLPTYDVFDESRYFEPSNQPAVVEIEGVKVGISICEDLWNDAQLFERQLYHLEPVDNLAAAGAEIMVNCSASPFVLTKHDFRHQLFANAAKRHGLPLLYVNQVGGNDELVFDGNSCAFNARGEVLAHGKDFGTDLVIVDLDEPGGDVEAEVNRREVHEVGMSAVYHALVLGLRDYCRKCGFKQVVLGLSGGIDSAVAACIAVGALGAENVTGITMPSRYSSAGSVSDAEILAERLGIAFHEIAIEGPHGAMEEVLQPLFEGTTPGVAEENIQARLRGLILMSYSNKFNAMLITTGNKSELAVGYCTLYGDMAGGLAVISDVPKTMVYDLAKWMNTDDCELCVDGVGPIPVDTITKPPSAELRPDQKDEDSLPAYEVLDEIIDLYVEREKSVRDIVELTGYEVELVSQMVKLIDRNEYKRKQAAPGIKITGRAFGFGRRMPIAQRYEA